LSEKQESVLEELKKIRQLLEPKPEPPPPPPPKGLMDEFKAFIEQYGVMGMAVAFIIGLYLGALVQALVSDIIMPIIGLALPGLADLASLQVEVNQQMFSVGHFLVALLTFLIVALVIFLIVKMTKRMGIQ
jgi:large conductance mechanosensitive channel